MQLLFNDKLAPITKEIGFIEASPQEATKAFLNWQRPLIEPRDMRLSQRTISGSLESILKSLMPLTDLEALRYLFIPTADPRWTAFFDNDWRGTNADTVGMIAQHLQSRGLRVVAVPNTIQGHTKGSKGRYGAIILTVYGPTDNPVHNGIRSISVVNDGGRWSFDQYGEPFPFEQTSKYSERYKKNRFTFEMLKDYLKEMSLFPFDEDFYIPSSNNEAILVEKKGRLHPGIKKYSLEEARAHYI